MHTINTNTCTNSFTHVWHLGWDDSKTRTADQNTYLRSLPVTWLPHSRVSSEQVDSYTEGQSPKSECSGEAALSFMMQPWNLQDRKSVV